MPIFNILGMVRYENKGTVKKKADNRINTREKPIV